MGGTANRESSNRGMVRAGSTAAFNLIRRSAVVNTLKWRAAQKMSIDGSAAPRAERLASPL
jgi:hypothetical protein